MWPHCSNTSWSHRGVESLHVDILKVCGGTWHMTVHPEPASGSDDTSHFGTSSRTGMLTFAHFTQSWGCPHSAVLLHTPHGRRNLASVAGNGLHHHGPYRCVAVAQPALCNKGNHLKAPAVGPPPICHHTPPTWGAGDDEHPPHWAGPRRQACQSFWSHSIDRCSDWWRYIVSHRPAQACHPPSGSSWPARRCRIICPVHREAFWDGTHPSCYLRPIMSLSGGLAS